MKRVKDTCFKSSLVILQFSFTASPQAKNDLWLDHPCGQQSKVYISQNSILLQVTRYLQLVRTHKQVVIRYSVIYKTIATRIHSEKILRVSLEILHVERDDLALLSTNLFPSLRTSL